MVKGLKMHLWGKYTNIPAMHKVAPINDASSWPLGTTSKKYYPKKPQKSPCSVTTNVQSCILGHLNSDCADVQNLSTMLSPSGQPFHYICLLTTAGTLSWLKGNSTNVRISVPGDLNSDCTVSPPSAIS